MAISHLAMKKTTAVLLPILFAVPFLLLKAQEKPEISPPKENDSFATADTGRKVRVQHGELALGNFQILGVNLPDNYEFAQSTKVLGKIETVVKGDAADFSEQACYRSVAENEPTYLIFGRGEVDLSFILSAESTVWKHNHSCQPSRKVTRRTATSSGLHLGQTQEQVIAILGLPTRRSRDARSHRDFFAYEFETRKRSDPQTLANVRREHLEMSEREFQENYGFYDLDETIEAKFVDNALTELKVVWVATT